MSTFEFEERACPRCGSTFEALTFWADDVVCGDCGRKDYAERLERANQRGYEVVEIGGAVPTQAQGRYADQRPFYFRARHGAWMLRVGPIGAPINYHDWADAAVVASAGDDPSHGWMEDAEVLAILDTYGGAA